MRVREIGSYCAGGRTVSVSGAPVRDIQVTRHSSIRSDPNGTYAVEHAWVDYFVPETLSDPTPVVLLHGGGLHGGMWSTTPDGRPGWLQTLLELGREVHVVDKVERGRAGWMPGRFEGDPILRTMEEAWRLFRLGRPEDFATRRTFAGCRFPVMALEAFARYGCPRWTSTRAVQTQAFAAVLERLGRSVVICHSQGGEIAFEAAAAAPQRVAQLIAVEPSGFAQDPTRLADLPITWVIGDFIDCDARWRDTTVRWQDAIAALRQAGARVDRFDCAPRWPGSTHMLMMDQGNEEIITALMQDVA
jgi:pimeloyl-ACP methyl ester carboxylesterase